jgi:hypothetical protein
MAAHQKIAILGHVDVDPAARDEVIASVVDLQRSTRDDEPGCLAYVIGSRTDPDRRIVGVSGSRECPFPPSQFRSDRRSIARRAASRRRFSQVSDRR